MQIEYSHSGGLFGCLESLLTGINVAQGDKIVVGVPVTAG
jgi:hypothetical protein